MIVSALVTEDMLKKINLEHSKPYRHYHGVDHINSIIRLIGPIQKYHNEMELAALFHDIVYDPGSNSNETMSNNFFLNSVKSGQIKHISYIDVDLVSKIILATKDHFSLEHDTAHIAVQTFLDYDLWDFGNPFYEVFDNNSKLLMNEFVEYNAKILNMGTSGKAILQKKFDEGRKDWLTDVKSNDNIFRVHTERNEMAFSNVNRSLEILSYE